MGEHRTTKKKDVKLDVKRVDIDHKDAPASIKEQLKLVSVPEHLKGEDRIAETARQLKSGRLQKEVAAYKQIWQRETPHK